MIGPSSFANDPATARLVIIPLESSSLETQANLEDSDNITEVLDGTTNERCDPPDPLSRRGLLSIEADRGIHEPGTIERADHLGIGDRGVEIHRLETWRAQG